MVIEYGDQRYGFSYLDITVGQLMWIQRLYGLSLKDIQNHTIGRGKGSVITALYWLMLCQNNSDVHPEVASCNVLRFTDAFVRACNKESTRPRPKKKKDEKKFVGTDFASQQFLMRQEMIEKRKQLDFTANAETADFTELFVSNVLEFSFLLHFTPEQVERLTWHAFFSYVEGIKNYRKSEAAQAQKQAQMFAGG